MENIEDRTNTENFKSPSLLRNIMFLFGVDTDKNSRISSSKTAKLCSAYQRFMSVLWIIYFLHFVAITFLYEIRSPVADFRESISRKFGDAIAFLLWLTLKSRCQRISDILNDILHLGSSLNVAFKQISDKIGALVAVGVPLTIWVSVFVELEERECKSVLTYFSFNYSYVGEGYNCKIAWIAMLSYQFATYTLRTCLAVLYVILCFHYNKLLHKLSKIPYKVSDISVHSSIRYHFITYESIIKALKSFENTMSLPIFLIEIGDCIAMFYCFVKMDPFHQSEERWFLKNYSLSGQFFALRAVLSFLCVSLAASRVHEACKNTKDIQEEMMKKIIVSDEKHKKEFLLLLVTHNSPPFTLSAWGFFYFDRGLILSAIGSILTYSLLILQLNTK
ncbi:hypothetical protein AVEN_257817-1 [Araneus ventricosus]|uniref:Gustatory receptor n=1 Tax=Araneus ventricosus TaxID=182803 RepID=A0A4Y2SL82_ARAVE|nr:hypothetical protein AVEN_257817-1 [Araneus ventricosus]